MAFLDRLEFFNDLLDAVGAEADVDPAGADGDVLDQQLGDAPLLLGDARRRSRRAFLALSGTASFTGRLSITARHFRPLLKGAGR